MSKDYRNSVGNFSKISPLKAAVPFLAIYFTWILSSYWDMKYIFSIPSIRLWNPIP